MKSSRRKNHSPLLIDEETLQVLPSLAIVVGLNEAIILNQMHYWLKKTNHVYEGKPWVFNTYKDWTRQFPFWSWQTIKYSIIKLEKRGIVVSANFNHNPIDKTKWYTIDYETLNRLLPTNDIDDQSLAVDDQSLAVDDQSLAVDDQSLAVDGATLAIDSQSLAALARANLEFNQETTPGDYTKEKKIDDDAVVDIIVSAEAFVQLFNATVPEDIPKVKTLSAKRRKKITLYLRQFPERDFWLTCFRAPKDSALLRGERPRKGHEGFKFTLDWLLTVGQDGTENCVKVYEGRYADTQGAKGAPGLSPNFFKLLDEQGIDYERG